MVDMAIKLQVRPPGTSGGTKEYSAMHSEKRSSTEVSHVFEVHGLSLCLSLSEKSRLSLPTSWNQAMKARLMVTNRTSGTRRKPKSLRNSRKSQRSCL